MTAPGRAFRARLTAALGHDTAPDVDDGLCDGSGWPMRPASAGTDGRVSCPLCPQRVTSTPTRAGAVVLDPHYTVVLDPDHPSCGGAR